VQELICGDGSAFEAPQELPREDVRIQLEQQWRQKNLMPPPQFDNPFVDPTPSLARADRAEEITHVSKTRLSESLS
jgi:hypothetical protein